MNKSEEVEITPEEVLNYRMKFYGVRSNNLGSPMRITGSLSVYESIEGIIDYMDILREYNFDPYNKIRWWRAMNSHVTQTCWYERERSRYMINLTKTLNKVDGQKYVTTHISCWMIRRFHEQLKTTKPYRRTKSGLEYYILKSYYSDHKYKVVYDVKMREFFKVIGKVSDVV